MKKAVDTWQGLVKDDVFTVTGAKGVFKFIHATFDEEKNEVIEVFCYGGLKGRQLMRTFAADRIVLPSKKSLQRQRTTGGTAAEKEGGQ